MGFYTTTSVTEKPHPETPSCAQKTASGNFFTYPIKTQYKNRHNSLKTNQEKPLHTHKTASGVFYYKFRHYSAELGRWLARDPIGERGGVNLYAFLGNDSLSKWDKLGLKAGDTTEKNKDCGGSTFIKEYNLLTNKVTNATVKVGTKGEFKIYANCDKTLKAGEFDFSHSRGFDSVEGNGKVGVIAKKSWQYKISITDYKVHILNEQWTDLGDGWLEVNYEYYANAKVNWEFSAAAGVSINLTEWAGSVLSDTGLGLDGAVGGDAGWKANDSYNIDLAGTMKKPLKGSCKICCGGDIDKMPK